MGERFLISGRAECLPWPSHVQGTQAWVHVCVHFPACRSAGLDTEANTILPRIYELDFISYRYYWEGNRSERSGVKTAARQVLPPAKGFRN